MDSLSLIGSYKIVKIIMGVLVIALGFMGFYRWLKQLKERFRVMRGEDKNLPESFSVVTTDGAHLVLERDWLDGEWRYVLKDLPYRFGPVERPKMSDAESIKLSKDEEKWSENMDILTKSPEYDAVVKARYGTARSKG